MKKILILAAIVLGSVSSVHADCLSELGIAFTPAQKLVLCSSFGSAIEQSLVPADDNTSDIGSAAKQWRSLYAGTSVVYGATASDKYPAAAVITPSTSFPTPSAGNTLSNRHTIVAAGAPTATYVVIPAATAIVGQPYTVYNQSSNPAAIVPAAGVINVAAALTPYACSAGAVCSCRGLTSGVIGCSQ